MNLNMLSELSKNISSQLNEVILKENPYRRIHLLYLSLEFRTSTKTQLNVIKTYKMATNLFFNKKVEGISLLMVTCPMLHWILLPSSGKMTKSHKMSLLLTIPRLCK